MFTLMKTYHFEAGHSLPRHDGKCKDPHGHSYRLEIHLKGSKLNQSGPSTGMLMDFSKINAFVKPMIETYLDHKWLNTSLNLPHATVEEIARWIYNHLKPQIPLLSAVTLHETPTCSVRYEPQHQV